MYLFLAKKVADKKISHEEIAKAFGVYKANPSGYLYALKTGVISIKLEHILMAQKHFGLNPCDLFTPGAGSIKQDISMDELSTVNESYESTHPTIYMEVIKSQTDIIKNQQETIHMLALGNVGGRKAS